MKVAHVITGLNRGGAEGALLRLVTVDPDPSRFHVISLLDDGVHGRALAAAGARVSAIGLTGPANLLDAVRRLGRILRSESPNVVQTWMYHADLLGGIAARLAHIPVCWGVRQSSLAPRHLKRSTRLMARTCAVLSHTVPAAIVACAHRAKEEHRRFGYADRFVVIPNGVDVSLYRRDPSLRDSVRQRLGIPPEANVVGHIGRADPIKDHDTLLRTFAHVARVNPRAVLLIAGAGLEAGERYLEKRVPFRSLRQRIVAVGPRDDVASLLNVMDVFLLTSVSEGFPNVVAEALAVGVPSVVTDCGDAADIVGDSGWVRPVGDVTGLAAAVLTALGEQGVCRDKRTARARKRAVERFGIDQMSAAYNALWRRVVDSGSSFGGIAHG